jgi:uncharacterized protein YxeA
MLIMRNPLEFQAGGSEMKKLLHSTLALIIILVGCAAIILAGIAWRTRNDDYKNNDFKNGNSANMNNNSNTNINSTNANEYGKRRGQDSGYWNMQDRFDIA